MLRQNAQILYQKRIAPQVYRMGLACADLAAAASPGQFVMVRVSPKNVPLLRRPFSIHRPIGEGKGRQGVELLYKVVGQGTQIMSQLAPGEVLDVLGPLGNGFTCPKTIKNVWLVAGGMGVASLYYLACELSKRDGLMQRIFLGGCSAADILCEAELRAMGLDIQVTTEDCTFGEKGLITSALEQALKNEVLPDRIFSCGPQAMLKAVGALAAEHGVPCQMSLEAMMACGFGVCLGCAVHRADGAPGYVHVCTDGPVFDAKEVRL
ncbi:MAG: dihydroorotate dehydrogenase electron transfer subunit [Deltaproteobacteria bacterium]|nr:dihydroorotate dehydrogenase electron transfer subunit [Deltaproteobacteria bacterium]